MTTAPPKLRGSKGLIADECPRQQTFGEESGGHPSGRREY
jgi:hypothetical protein